MFESILIIIVGALLIVTGIFNFKGNLKLLHSYHYKRVSEEDKKPFSKLVGTGSLIIGGSILTSGILTMINYFTKVAVLETIGMIVAISGLALGLTLCFYAMFKYNKGPF